MIQLILHMIGDYITQTDCMATNKTKNSWAALAHATVYSLPFLFIGSWKAVLVIWITHFFIDRFRLARYVVFVKNSIGPNPPKWEDCQATGYPSAMPPWLSVWLMIVADNTLHLTINHFSLLWL